MNEAISTALSQFGLAGFVAWMWFTERRASATREKQIAETHDRLMQERRTIEAVLGALDRSTAAMTAVQEGQRTLAGAVDRLVPLVARVSDAALPKPPP